MEIVTYILKKGIPEKLSKKLGTRFKSEADRLDFIQEMYLILLEIPKDKLEKMYKAKELENYFSRIVINQIINPQSSFRKKYEYNIEKIELPQNESTEEE